MISIALFEPEIPPNTGNIARLCVGLDITLYIIGKPSFDLSEKAVRRAGLDYWSYLRLSTFETWESFLQSNAVQRDRIFGITKFGKKCYYNTQFQSGDCFLFGKETTGLPDYIHTFFSEDKKLYIPMPGAVRSLNLSNAVAVVAYEAFRQINLELNF
jgi:tRNA (cytidine/uridine-2'-O-)-methyltransferase